jgi:hypothetical protein
MKQARPCHASQVVISWPTRNTRGALEIIPWSAQSMRRYGAHPFETVSRTLVMRRLSTK